MPLPPAYLLEQTVTSAAEPEYCMPPQNEQPEYAFPTEDHQEQIVTVKTTPPKPTQNITPKHSKQSSDEYDTRSNKSG